MQKLTRFSSWGCSPQEECSLKPNDVSAVYNRTDYKDSESICIKTIMSHDNGYPPLLCDIKAYIATSSPSQRISRQQHPIIESISLLSTDEITITPVRELSYDDAKREIRAYIHKMGYRRVYVSEIAEKLVIDFDLIEDILEDIKKDTYQHDYV